MRWSRYNTLFKSQRFGCFLYNAMSNVLFEIDKPHYDFLEQLQHNSQLLHPDIDDQFMVLLREQKILVKENEEAKSLMARHYRRGTLGFDNAHLSLSICPTLSCNFRCSYCFEQSQQNTTVMKAQVIDRLIFFIKRFKQASSLSITWYGGEPTMAYDVICDITQRVKAMGINFIDAGLVTNGYLLRADKISRLNDLNIKTIQITLDGPQGIHDSRRTLSSGRKTYQQIIDNIDTLMNSSYGGSCNIRVNVDKKNQSDFFELRTHLLERFKGKNLSVYAGHVDTATDHKYDKNCNLCAEEWAGFTIEQYHQNSATHGKGVYPNGSLFNICSANSHNSFVIGPEGELYKCWEDVGKQNMVVGSIFEDEPVTNPELVALYSVGTDPYLDPVCQECSTLPICGGGCVNRRLRAKHFHEGGLNFCSLYKDNLITFLMEYYDVFRTKEICDDLLNPVGKARNEKGYRMVHPESEAKMSGAGL